MRGVNTGYALAYRFGFTPWERYGTAAAASIGALLDREEAERSRPLGRALDNVARAIDAASHSGVPGATFVVGDVTDLERADLGMFDFFIDVGCFQHLDT